MLTHRRLPLLLAISWLLCLASPSQAAVLFDFEGLADGTHVLDAYLPQGAVFTNATIVTAGLSLNDAEFPVFSGVNAALDDGGPIRVDFTSPVGSVSAYFTYVTTLQLTAFDSSNSPVASATSAFALNFVSSGNPPNEFIQVVAAGIDHVVIQGDPAGGSFLVDDLSFDAVGVADAGVPEPSSLLLFVTTLAVILRTRKAGKKEDANV